ncbi:MAG: hypothetical protein ACI9HK_004286 [Pirellulaceae bacterium]|jgi:hypothetical protein
MAEETTSSAARTSKPTLSWRRTLIYFALCSTMLIFDGCGASYQYFTVGIVPAAQIATADGLSLELKSFWWSGLLLHILSFFIAAWFIAVNSPWLTGKFQSFKMLIAWVIVWSAHNSFSVPNVVWFYGVYVPNAYIHAAIRWLFAGNESTPFANSTITAWSGRINALLLIITVYLILIPISWLYQRYVLVKGSRWQFTLAGVLLLTLVFGVGFGMLIRIWQIFTAEDEVGMIDF